MHRMLRYGLRSAAAYSACSLCSDDTGQSKPVRYGGRNARRAFLSSIPICDYNHGRKAAWALPRPECRGDYAISQR